MQFWLDISQLITNIIASVGIVVGGWWALRHFWHERPFEPNLSLKLSASAVRIDEKKILIHFEFEYTNTGKARFQVENSMNAPRESLRRTYFKVFGLKPRLTEEIAVNDRVNWENTDFADIIYDGWFPDTPNITQESGETEVATLDLLVHSDIRVINAWVKIWEDANTRKAPYFWSTSRVFSIERMIASIAKQA